MRPMINHDSVQRRRHRWPFLLVATVLMAATLVAQTVNGDFESGNTGFSSGYTFGNVTNPATYTIGSDASSVAGSYADWEAFGDHTSGSGLMLIANGGTSASTAVWSQTVSVTPGTPYVLRFWGATVNTVSGSPANIVAKINGTSVGGSNVFPTQSPATGGAWVQFAINWNSGASTSAAIELFDSNTAIGYNDFALDDISLTDATPVPTMSPLWIAILGMVLALTAWYSFRHRAEGAVGRA